MGVLMAMGYRAKKRSWVYYVAAVLVVPLALLITYASPYVPTVVAEGAVAALLGIICGTLTWIRTHKSRLIAALTVICGIVLVLGVFG
jgi:membrane associated rhomboid family serine protease